MKVAIRRIGNGRGIILSKAVLANAGLEDEAELSIEDCRIVLRNPIRAVRAGWADAATAIAKRDRFCLTSCEPRATFVSLDVD